MQIKYFYLLPLLHNDFTWGREVATKLDSQVRLSLVTSEDAGSNPAVDSWSLPHVILICGVFFSPLLDRFSLGCPVSLVTLKTHSVSHSSFLSGVHSPCCRTRRPNLRIKKMTSP